MSTNQQNINLAGPDCVGQYHWDLEAQAWFRIKGHQPGPMGTASWTLQEVDGADEPATHGGDLPRGLVFASPIVIDGVHYSPYASLAWIKRFAESHGAVATIEGDKVAVIVESVAHGQVITETEYARNRVEIRVILGY